MATDLAPSTGIAVTNPNAPSTASTSEDFLHMTDPPRVLGLALGASDYRKDIRQYHDRSRPKTTGDRSVRLASSCVLLWLLLGWPQSGTRLAWGPVLRMR